jgi:hypothetical protein
VGLSAISGLLLLLLLLLLFLLLLFDMVSFVLFPNDNAPREIKRIGVGGFRYSFWEIFLRA